MATNQNNTPIGSFVENAITLFGSDVNKKRQLPSVYDGLKPSYRRLIYTTLGYGDKFTKVAAIVGSTIATTHPHGDSSLLQPTGNLCRWGIFDGHGNMGAKTLIGQDIEMSAPRYVSAKVNAQYRKFFSDLMPYVPYLEAEIEGNVEPQYMPTPYPLCLTFGTLGIGVGVNCRIPAFTMKSMHKAYLSDNPDLLEAPFGLHIVKEKSDLKSLWNTGIGQITYSYNVYQSSCEAGFGTFIEGSAELFKPKLSLFNKWIDSGRVFILDKSDSTSDRVFISRNYNVKAVNFDMIQEAAIQASENTKVYRLTVADENNVYLIPLKNWLDVTYKNYISLLNTYKIENIKKYEFDYKVFEYLPEAVELLYNHRDWDSETIFNEMYKLHDDITLDIVRAIMKKSISTLRNVDSTAKLTQIQQTIDEYKAMNPIQRINEIISKF